VNNKNYIKSHLHSMRTIIELLLYAHRNYHKENNIDPITRIGIGSLPAMIDHLETLRIATCSSPKKKLNKLYCNYFNCNSILLIPEGFDDMPTEEMVKEYCNETNAPQFTTITYESDPDKTVNDIRTLCEQKFNGEPVNIYILGHGHRNGRAVGSKTEVLLSVKKLLEHLNVIFWDNEVPSRIILTFCNGHNNSEDYKNIMVEAVTSAEIPLAMYLDKYNISLMIYLLKIYIEIIYEVKFDN